MDWLQRRGKTCYVLPSTPGEKQCERGERRVAVAQVQGAVPTAAQCWAAGNSLPEKELVATATALWVWFRQSGSALAWLVSVAALWLRALCQGCSVRSCSPQQSREQGRWGMWGAGRAQRQEVCLERHLCSYCGEKSGIQRAPGCVHELVGRVW